MTDNSNLIESIQHKQAQLLMELDELKSEDIRDFEIIESIQREQATLADEINHWLEKQQIKGEEEND